MLRDYRVGRRTALGLLLSAAVFPPALGAQAAHARATPIPQMPTAGQSSLTDALRRTDKPNLRIRQIARIAGRRHRVTFHQATWDGGQTVIRDLEIRRGNTWLKVTDDDHRFDEQWIVFRGPFPASTAPPHYYSAMEPYWISFDSCEQVGSSTVELRASRPGVFELAVRWTLDGDNPELHYVLTARRDDDFIVGYQGFDVTDLDHVDEVLCGALQHAKVIADDPYPRAAWELFAPMALTQRVIDDNAVTLGLYIPSEVIAFEHERALGSDRQPFGMSLRNDSDDVAPTIYAPHVGLRTPMRAGQKRGFAFGICAFPQSLYPAYTDLLRGEYGYRGYRENVYDTSLTGAVHNIIDLVRDEPDGDDSENFVPSYSGWWNRAKGFIDVENDQAVRTAVAGVLLSAHYLTGQESDDRDLYQARARHIIEYQLSRKSIGYTPVKGKSVYGVAGLYRLGQIPGDTVTLNALYHLMRRQSAGVHQLGLDTALQGKVGQHRSPFAVSLAAYQLTGDKSYLTEATLIARRYIRDEINTPYTTNVAETNFGYGYCRYWSDLLVLHEITGDREFLDGAYREVQRFVTQIQVRPVPSGNVTVADGHVVQQQYDWPDGALPDYPVSEVPVEKVPAWLVSTNGLTFEQLSTFKVGTSETPNPGGGFVFNPCWAPFLLRLAYYVDDPLLGDIAHNLVTGRFTNYPGYYSRQFHVVQMKPDFTFQGPVGVPGVWYHHAPAQLGLAIDYLISDHFVRSAGKVSYPRVVEANFVYFNFGVYGHAPGTFYGETGVWPYFPQGLIKVDNHQINWLTGVGNDSLYLSLTNSSAREQSVTIDINTPLIGLTGPVQMEHIDRDGHRRPGGATSGQVRITVPARGISSLVFRGVSLSAPWHRTPAGTDRGNDSHHSVDTDPGSDFGLARGILLTRPDGQGYDAYVSIDTEEPAVLRYRINNDEIQQTPSKPFPYEWTIGVDDPTGSFSYSIVTGSVTTDEVTLRLPPMVTASVPPGSPATGELECASTTTAGATVPVLVRLRNGTDAPLTGLSISVNAPPGWPLTTGDVPVEVPARGTVEATVTVSVPTAAAWQSYELSGTATWNGGSAALRPAQTRVRDPRRVVSMKADPAVLDKPGDTTRFTVVAMNSSAVPVQGTLRLNGQTGWVIENSAVPLEIGPESEAEHTFVVHSPTTADWGGRFQFRVRLDDVHTTVAQVRLRDAGIIVHNESPWPAYRETGQWLRSGLVGWNNIRSRYSAPEITGGTAIWTPTLTEAGLYNVAVWYPTNADTTTEATYVVTHADGEETLVVDQRMSANGWRLLGQYLFDAGNSGHVTLEVHNELFHRGSAVRFLPVETS